MQIILLWLTSVLKQRSQIECELSRAVVIFLEFTSRCLRNTARPLKTQNTDL